MNPQRRRRLLWVLLLLVASGLSTALVALALQRNLAYLYTPVEVLRGDAGHAKRFRLGGMVTQGSLQRESGSLKARFVVTDGDASMTVHSEQILPDLFREGQAVVITGRRQGDAFIAEEVLAKHDETYMPREVAEKMGKAHVKHDVVMPAPAPGAD